MSDDLPKRPILAPFCSGPFRAVPHTHWIEGVDAFGGRCHMLDVRGWGYLTGKGTALALDPDKAIQAQNETAEWVVKALNAQWEKDRT